MTSYDDIPYPSHSYVNSDPARLKAIAMLFGMTSLRDLNACKILEIGCASGGNLLPMAARYPNSDFMGVDLSSVQITDAQNKADAMALSNVRFIAGSIADVDFKNQEFDYIIAHGVYSWVPEEIQDCILQICDKHLSKSGIAYISYNTLPGWNAVKTVRDMMLYHVAKFDDPAQRITEARGILNFIAANIKSGTGPHKETLEHEIKTLQNADDNYLLHDHLEAVNAPCYFHQFMDKAAANNLAYLGDAELQSMYLGNQTEDAANILGQLNDVTAQEQYMDFITNRRFRMTLLVKEGVHINRKLTPKSLKNLQFSANFGLQKPLDVTTLETVENLQLAHLKNPEHTASLTGRVVSASYLHLLKTHPTPLSLKKIVSLTQIKDMSKTKVEAELSAMFLKLIFNGVLSITSEGVERCQSITATPESFMPARVEGRSKNLVPNLYHETIKLTNDQRLTLQYVNGQNTKLDIMREVETHINNNELNLAANGEPLAAGSEELKKYLPDYIDAKLAFFAANALLVA